MADNTLQFNWIVVIKEGPRSLFLDDPNVFVAGNLLWYPVEGKPTIRTAPDAMVAFGRPKGRRGSYKQWEEGNVAPQVVFEILSPGNRPDEMERKFEFYEKYGVEEYYIYDPDDGTLEGWLRKGDHLEKVADMAGFVSPRLDIRFEPGEGPDNLKIFGPDGEPFQLMPRHPATAGRTTTRRRRTTAQGGRTTTRRRRTTAQEPNARRADRRRRQTTPRPNDERDAERQRAERYAAKLRELGIEPD